MMHSKWMQQLLRVLVTLLGAGIGVALTLGVVQIIHMSDPSNTIPVNLLVFGYAGMALLGGIIFFVCGKRMVPALINALLSLDKHMDTLTLPELIARIVGLTVGLVIAFLLSQLLSFMGSSLFTTIFGTLLYLIFGTWGYTIGRKRSQEAEQLLSPRPVKPHHFRRKKSSRLHRKRSTSVRVLDSSVLIDGRVADICRLGFLDGELLIPDFVLDELRRIADAADPLRRARGRRGLDVVSRLQALPVKVRCVATDPEDTGEVDVRLLRMAQKYHASLMTGDFNLAKVAQVSGVQVLNLNELASVLRPVVAAGDQLDVTIVKDGKEAGQGIGYMPDGTMVVIEGGRALMNQTVSVTVTSALQTSAGRMIFARAA